MRGNTIKMTIPRDDVKGMVEEYIAATMVESHVLKDWTVHRDGSIGVTVQRRTSKEPELPLESTGISQE